MTSPDFRRPSFLLDHIRHTMAFYHPRSIDPSGGFFHFFRDDGTIYDHSTRHLVSSTRFVFNNAMAYRHLGDAAYQEAAAHGVPTVAFATGGVVDAVAEGQSGYLVTPGDYPALAQATLKILTNQVDAWRASSQAFAEQFAWPILGDKMRAALNAIPQSTEG